MTGELEYLEKYSVAPAPSRDYYGIRIIRDEVKLFIWKISHGPHRTRPQLRVTNFAHFANDKSLQDEILGVFGRTVLNYVIDLTAGKTNNSEDNSSPPARDWTRVFDEARTMQNCSVKIGSSDKRRVGGALVKVGAYSKSRVKLESKTPLKVIKTNPAARHREILSPTINFDQVSEKMRRMRVVGKVITRDGPVSSGQPPAKSTTISKRDKSMIAPRSSSVAQDDYEIENGWSSNSSIASAPSPASETDKLKRERSYNKYKTATAARESIKGNNEPSRVSGSSTAQLIDNFRPRKGKESQMAASRRK